MKPSLQDIDTLNNKATFLSWLLSRFGENEFTNSEMKKVYDEDVTKAFSYASIGEIEKAIKKFAPNNAFPLPRLVSVDVLAKENKVTAWFGRIYYCKTYPLDKLIKYIDPSLSFLKSYTLNKTFNCCQFYTTRKENITIRTKKAVGTIPAFSGGRQSEETIYNWDSEEELKYLFRLGTYHIEEDETKAVKYYFKLNSTKTASYIMNYDKAARRLRKERTQCLINEMTEADRVEVLERLADYYGYFLE